ncbi:hypothetical protein VBH15_09530 [Vagococcus fluvialis]|uniref:hypothetical protein n=1 Tax=Vagococcus fluvialis TaxID=2738 RepID=UPI0037D6BCC7
MGPNKAIDEDYYSYLTFVSNRVLITETDLKNKFKDCYKLIYMSSEIIAKFEDLDKRSHIDFYLNEMKNDLIISLDLLNMNYLTASKKVLRSSVEAFFRVSLAIKRYVIYQENVKNKNFSVTSELAELKSIIDAHKVYKLTSSSVDFYKDSEIADIIMELNTFYSELSGSVHVNSIAEFTPKQYLSEYSLLDEPKCFKYLDMYTKIITNILLSMLLFLKQVKRFDLHKNKIALIANFLTPEQEEILESIEIMPYNHHQ